MDAIMRLGSRIKQESLGDAYKQAGRAFVGQLEQHIVVFKEERHIPIQTVQWPLEDQTVPYKRSFGRGK
jgi:hypothetical protein